MFLGLHPTDLYLTTTLVENYIKASLVAGKLG